jgi:allantoicase
MAHSTVKEIIKQEPAFTQFTDLAAERLGGGVLFATDDFFAEKENLLKPGRGIFIADKYTDRGKWMDGWESRRKRTPGHDWAVIQLATSGIIRGFDIDTNFFLGNHPPHASVEGISMHGLDADANWNELPWEEILPKSPLDAGSRNFFECKSPKAFTHIRLHIYPDGGVARLRVYGDVSKDWSRVSSHDTLDLAAAINGGRAIACNDMFFSAMSNLVMPNRGANMGDGWETKRNRTPGNCDWVKLRLAHKGIIEKILVDTCHFKGNYPDRCMIEACVSNDDDAVLNDTVKWVRILPEQKLKADHEHHYHNELTNADAYTHIKLNIYPDGGISRLRIFGKIKD